MVDIDDNTAKIYSLPYETQLTDDTPAKRVYRVTWVVHNVNHKNEYFTTRRERLFETEEAAKRFNLRRQEAANLIGLMEGQMTGHPQALELEK